MPIFYWKGGFRIACVGGWRAPSSGVREATALASDSAKEKGKGGGGQFWVFEDGAVVGSGGRSGKDAVKMVKARQGRGRECAKQEGGGDLERRGCEMDGERCRKDEAGRGEGKRKDTRGSGKKAVGPWALSWNVWAKLLNRKPRAADYCLLTEGHFSWCEVDCNRFQFFMCTL